MSLPKVYFLWRDGIKQTQKDVYPERKLLITRLGLSLIYLPLSLSSESFWIHRTSDLKKYIMVRTTEWISQQWNVFKWIH